MNHGAVKMTAHVKRRQTHEHRMLDELAEVMPAGVPAVGFSYPALAERLGESANAMLAAKRTFEAPGILRTRISYEPGRGRTSTWELTMPLDRAHEGCLASISIRLEGPSRKAEQRRADDVAGAPAVR